MPTKKELKDYITTVAPLKPSAEVKFRSTDENGEVTESVASRTYVAQHADKEIAAVSQNKGLNDRLNKVIETAGAKAVREQEAQDDLDALEAEVDAEEMLDESASVAFVKSHTEGDGAKSPMTHVPNAQHEGASTAELSETAMLIKLVSVLIDKIDAMQNFNPVIHVPAPVIHVTLPETKRTVTKAVERDENNWIKTVREHIEETPVGEPLIEVKQAEPTIAPKTRKRKPTPKDNK
jgi:hypothetical protein